MKILTVMSLSGGMGKTTCTLFLSQILASSGKKVLAVDCDPQANLSFYLGCDLDASQPSLLEAIKDQVEIEDSLYVSRDENLLIIPSDRNLVQANDYLAQSGVAASLLRRRFSKIQDAFDYCLIDVQPSRSQLSLSAVGAADHILIPVEATTKGFNSMVDSLEFLNHQQRNGAFSGQILGVIPFRDRWVGKTQTLESRDSIKAIKEFAGEIPIFYSIPESEKYKQAIRKGAVSKNEDILFPFVKIVEALTDAR
jgi:chromosome partitioning protein